MTVFTNFYGGAFFGGGFFGAGTSTGDTHDGDGRKRYEEVPGFDETIHTEQGRKDALRTLIADAIDPKPSVHVPPEVLEIAKPYVKRLESGPKIDWNALAREKEVRARLYELAQEHARMVAYARFIEEEEEDLTLLLWN